MAFDSKQGHPIKGGDANNKHSMNSSSRGVSSEKFYTLFIVQVLLSTEFQTKSPTVSEFEKYHQLPPYCRLSGHIIRLKICLEISPRHSDLF